MNFQRAAAICCLFLLIFFFGLNHSLAGVSIAPAFVKVSLDEKRPAGRFVITNTGTETERYRIAASHFIFGDRGEMKKKKPDENSLAPWIKFNPKEFSLPAKSKRVIRYVIVPRGKLESKTYWCFMELQSLKVNAVTGEDKHGRSMKLKIIPTIVVPIFASKGKIPYDATIGETRFEKSEKGFQIHSLVNNSGKGHLVLTGNFEVLDSTGALIKKGGMGKNYILPGGKRFFTGVIDVEVPKGNYKVNVAYSDPNLKGGMVTGTVEFSQ